MMAKTQSYHHGDAHDALIDEAYKQIGRAGEDAFSLRACARAVGLDVAAAYRHFSSKQDLVQEVGLRGFACLSSVMATRLSEASDHPSPTAQSQLLVLAEAYADFARANSYVFRTMFAHPEIRQRFEVHATNEDGETALQILQHAIEHLVADLELKPGKLDHAEQLFWGSIHGLVVLHLQGFVPDDPGKFALLMERQVRVTIMGLASSCR